LSLLLFYVWMPDAEARSKQVIFDHRHHELNITAEVMIPMMLQNQYANIHESLDALLDVNPEWVSLVLHDENGNLIYPLSLPDIPLSNEHFKIEHDIKIRGAVLGRLSLISDLSEELKIVRTENFKLLQMLIVGLFAGLAAIMVLLDRFVRKPARDLSFAAEQLSKGDYSVHFPVPTKDEIGALTQSFITMRDAIGENEASLRAAKEEAEASNKAKSEFLSSMSHELRTPLNAILGFAQVLDFNPNEPLSPKQKNSTDQIIKGGKHLLNLIDEVLNLAKIEAGHVNLNIEPVDTQGVVDECIAVVNNLTYTLDLSIHCDDFKGSTILADEVRFKQVLLNLLSNAVKYNREGGTVTISSTVVENGMQRISVADTGLGISVEKQSELFQPFSRLGAENSNIEGTGIGLTITQRLLECMGGNINFRTVEGQGSTFWVDLPLAEGKKVQAPVIDENIPEDHSVAVSAGRVLYVEDNPANIILMETILDSIPGIGLETAHTAEIGIAMAIQDRPDLILMDISLPGMDGDEALVELRNHEETRDIPVVAISANAMPNDIDKALKAGFLKYLTKPFNVPELLETVSSVLEKDGKLSS